MENTITTQKVHYLNKSMRFLMIGSGLIVWIIPLMPFLAHATNPGDIRDFIIPLAVIFIASVACLIYVFRCRLVTTNRGIENYSSFPFHSFISWQDLLAVEKGGFGSILLTAIPKANTNTNQTIAISTFIDNWDESELVNEIRKFAPQLRIPQEFQKKKETPFFYRTSTLLIYDVVSMFFILLPYGLLPVKIAVQYRGVIGSVGIGSFVATLGGMEGLFWFGEWRDKHPNIEMANRLLLFLYLIPFCGIAEAYIIYLIFQTFSFLPKEFMDLSIIILCGLQFRLILRFLGKRLFSKQL